MLKKTVQYENFEGQQASETFYFHMEFEITRSEGRYDQEVLGLEHADESARRRKRVRFDDE